jgi:hypothetical protein
VCTPLPSVDPETEEAEDLSVRRERGYQMVASRFRRIGSVVALTTLFAALGIQGPPAGADPVANQVIAWNDIAYREIITLKSQPPPVALLNFAIVHAAVYDAVNAIEGGYEPYLGSLGVADPGDSVNAAVAEAAYTVLAALVPSPSADLATDHTVTLGHIRAHEGDAATDGGIAVGLAAATAILGDRSGDNRTSPTSFSELGGTGDWEALVAGLPGNNFRWVANLRPFLIQDAGDFATKGPRSLGSAEYAAEFNEVKSLGRVDSTTRTADQTMMARFWNENAVATWTRISRQLAVGEELSTADSARLYAMLYMTGEDALIACFEDKERWHFWRPTTAIHDAELDGNSATVEDDGWTALLGVPPYPDHPSGHNCFSGSVVRTLQQFFGTDDMSFWAQNSVGRRDFGGFSEAIKEIRKARVYGGLHFMTPDVQGANLGRKVANYRNEHYFGPVA